LRAPKPFQLVAVPRRVSLAVTLLEERAEAFPRARERRGLPTAFELDLDLVPARALQDDVARSLRQLAPRRVDREPIALRQRREDVAELRRGLAVERRD